MGNIDKKGDISITSEKADVQIGVVEDELDGGAAFLRQNGFTDEHTQELLDDKDRNTKLVQKVDLIGRPTFSSWRLPQLQRPRRNNRKSSYLRHRPGKDNRRLAIHIPHPRRRHYFMRPSHVHLSP